jgi:hypothetical protein
MRGRWGAWIVLCAVMSGAAMAQAPKASGSTPPSREQVLKLMSAMGVQQSVDESLHQAQSKLKDAARESFLKQYPNADAATLKKLDAVVDDTPFFKFEDIAEVVIPVYQRNLSADDVQAGIDFYSSEHGKRLLEKVPVILREANEEGGKVVQSKMEAYGDTLERNLEAFRAQVQKTPPPASQPAAGGAGKAKEGKSK